MFGRFGWAEILVIVVLVLILFGHNKIPGMMKNLADGINIFKKELKETKPAAKDVPGVAAPAVKKSPAKAAAKKTVKHPVKTASRGAEKKTVKKSAVKK